MTKAADISDERMLDALRQDIAHSPGRYGHQRDTAPRWKISEDLGMPEKVVLAKLKSMLRRGLVTGCACGCSGDFAPTGKANSSE